MGREENVSHLSDTPYAQPPQWKIKKKEKKKKMFQTNLGQYRDQPGSIQANLPGLIQANLPGLIQVIKDSLGNSMSFLCSMDSKESSM